MAQDIGVIQDLVPEDGIIIILPNVQVIVTELFTILPGGVLDIHPGGKLVIVP